MFVKNLSIIIMSECSWLPNEEELMTTISDPKKQSLLLDIINTFKPLGDGELEKFLKKYNREGTNRENENLIKLIKDIGPVNFEMLNPLFLHRKAWEVRCIINAVILVENTLNPNNQPLTLPRFAKRNKKALYKFIEDNLNIISPILVEMEIIN